MEPAFAELVCSHLEWEKVGTIVEHLLCGFSMHSVLAKSSLPRSCFDIDLHENLFYHRGYDSSPELRSAD